MSCRKDCDSEGRVCHCGEEARISQLEADLRAAIDERDRAQAEAPTLRARIAELEGLVSHTACTIDIWNDVDAGDEMEQVIVDTGGMLKAALGGDPAKDARDQPEILRHLPERTS